MIGLIPSTSGTTGIEFTAVTTMTHHRRHRLREGDAEDEEGRLRDIEELADREEDDRVGDQREGGGEGRDTGSGSCRAA